MITLWLRNALIVFFLSMTPLAELRLGIPYGMGVLKMATLETFFWGVLGNIIPVIILLKLLPLATEWIFRHSNFLKTRLKKYFERLHVQHSTKFNRLGALFLAAFVAVPLPGTGAWTGALLAYLFNIPFWLAFGSISLGVVGAGVIVAFLSESVRWLL